MKRNLLLVFAVLTTSCGSPPLENRLTLVIAGQALIKVDPRTIWSSPFTSVRPFIESSDLAFTNFEMAVSPPDTRCAVPGDYVTITGEPSLPREQRPGNTDAPHAVSADVMEFLASIGFQLMSLANNHAWDLGKCGIIASIEAAKKHSVVHAGTGLSAADALEPAYIDIEGTTFALVAATTSRDERDLLLDNVNGVWTGYQGDWDRNVAAVKEAAANADFVLYYQHFQIDEGDFEDVNEGEQNEDGHFYIDSVQAWQDSFARAIIDAGASMYLGHGHRGFDGIEIYRGRPLIRQFGGFAYHAMRDIGGYPGEYAFWGLLGVLSVKDGSVTRMEFIPLVLNEGRDLIDQYGHMEFLRRRGMPEVATGELADSILLRLHDLSEGYGTEIQIANQRAVLEIHSGG
ncbi:MAG TPA: hypothetical protein EYO83_04330 [Gemmatimonadetes bacterium]|jgi:poly-gamma-glutamate synthesis protein (capsule biosynthesis protein)|nr:hypothetical protein [Gemmatimonadota bacterium]